MNISISLLPLISALAISTPLVAAGQEKIGSAFYHLDNDDNGYISKEEADDNNIWRHFSQIDSNNDGKLTRNEFNRYLYSSPASFDEGIKEAKKEHDEGYAVADRIEEGNEKADYDLNRGNRPSDQAPRPPAIENSFEELDRNDNGRITMTEAEERNIAYHFGYADKDVDYALTRIEFNTYVDNQQVRSESERR
ncbi:EF-hand domain-containing protein [Bowmanella dokdonensis]|uniref:EF-hand domain-containing protein n=1 Tax=Bowmanella dokdonensis TaxID=751969 RepID=A0A939DTM6_9ALTE|nr:EF-hand domain-containing protein [Bowmanella dokdonensis]MBN7827706.1 EF-hand domain-containing protein [Bowmanella dokdonensis]